MTRKAQAGFTLIELVVVITILGILAAFAVPRFASLEVQARSASIQALAGSVRSGAALAHALWLAQGGTAGSVSMEGTNISITNGYPALGSIDETLADTSGFTYTPGATSGVFSKDGAANCTVTYTPAAANGTPQIVVNSTCN